MTVPCATCPWRKGSDVNLIPGFSMELARSLLETTCGDEDDWRSVMACHGSTEEDNRPCIGYVQSDDGWRNLAVRMSAITNRIDLAGIRDDCADLDLYDTYADALDNMEDQIA